MGWDLESGGTARRQGPRAGSRPAAIPPPRYSLPFVSGDGREHGPAGPVAIRPAADGRPGQLLERLTTGDGTIALHAAVDAVAVLTGFALASLTMGGVGPAGALAEVWAFAVLTLLLLALRGSYGDELGASAIERAREAVGAASFASMALLAAAAAGSTPIADQAEVPLLIRVWLFSAAALAGGRALVLVAQRRLRVQRGYGRPTVIVGTGRVAALVARRLRTQPHLGLRPVAFVDDWPRSSQHARDLPVLGPVERLPEIVSRTGADHLVLAFPCSRGCDERLVGLLRSCERMGVKVCGVPRFFDAVNMRAALRHVGGLPLVEFRGVDPSAWPLKAKDAVDRLAAVALLVAFAPVMLAAAIAVKTSSPGPLLYRQLRVGRGGHIFEILKFRTMKVTSVPPAARIVRLGQDLAPGGVEGEDRRTRVGRFLRATSLDELPQFLNVLRGEMSLVGPRPERPDFVEQFTRQVPGYQERHELKPGITGWAQVHGLRGKTSISDRAEWDRYYVRNWSPWLDLKILAMTLLVFFKPVE